MQGGGGGIQRIIGHDAADGARERSYIDGARLDPAPAVQGVFALQYRHVEVYGVADEQAVGEEVLEARQDVGGSWRMGDVGRRETVYAAACFGHIHLWIDEFGKN